MGTSRSRNLQVGRIAATVGAEFEASLRAYAAAAVAAGVGTLALSAHVEAKIVYTPTNVEIPFRQAVPLYLNNAGIADFSFFRWNGSGWSALWVLRQGSNEIWGRGTNRRSFTSFSRFASALPAGRRVGANKTYFGKGDAIMSEQGRCLSSSTCTAGQWLYMKDHYLGLKFFINGEVHYGWARLNGRGKNAPVLTGYAYETIPNKLIITGKTKGPDVVTLPSATLGHLALGASPTAWWRMRPWILYPPQIAGSQAPEAKPETDPNK